MDGLKVIVVGAGMGGLTAALALRHAGFEVEVYDRVRELTPAGAGISLWSNGVKVLNRLGLGSAIARIGGPMDQICYRAKTGETLTQFSLEPLVQAVGQRPYPVARTDLQALLLGAAGSSSVHLDATCVGVEQDENGATAVFADGRRATGDLVVGADGTHSVIRGLVLGSAAPRRHVGYVNWNGLVPAGSDLAPAGTWVTYVGEHKRASLMPVGGGRLYFFFDVPLPLGAPADPAGVGAELRGHFAGWAAPVQSLISRLDPKHTSRIEIFDIEPLPRLVRGRVALLGDAGHSMAPDLGQGGCQAMEDAWVLANSLLTTNVSVVDALLRYQVARQSRTTEIVKRARKRADVTHGTDPDKTRQWYAELAREDGASILRAIADTVLGGPLQ
jgi:FAD-dependent urate hydroxylase